MTRYLSRKRPDGEPDPATRLFCFPYAGGGASAYRRWQRGLDAHDAGVRVLPVQLPGREERFAEPRFTDLDALIDDMDAQLDEELSEPHIFYGHSMGALLAYSLARRRQRRGAPLPRALVLSAYRAPHLPAPPIADPDAGDAALVAGLTALGGIPQTLLDHPEFLSALLPVARDDLRLCLGSGAAPAEPLRVPLHLFAGRGDRLVAVSEVAAWERHAGYGCELRTMPGGHFFVRSDEGAFLRELALLTRRYATERVAV
ncbi:thioesterase II family protein [Streptomyces shenzhenensis]|uniref:thioesterase II family protein n=1 Tax=Streptomyces shenzhenensis TaxID=943815 RepID=UPI00217E4E72|nr:alpha/beta fold hydrolase [Streptomyces shenzhenensis]